jgi:hypothetical protein
MHTPKPFAARSGEQETHVNVVSKIHAGDPLTPLRNPASREPGVIFLSKSEGCWMFPASAGLALLALAKNCGQSTVSSCSRGGGFV